MWHPYTNDSFEFSLLKHFNESYPLVSEDRCFTAGLIFVFYIQKQSMIYPGCNSNLELRFLPHVDTILKGLRYVTH